MAHHKSALKKIRRDEKRRLRNKAVRTRFRNLVKEVREAIDAGDKGKAEAALTQALPYLQKSVNKGVYHQNKVARDMSRLTRGVNALGA